MSTKVKFYLVGFEDDAGAVMDRSVCGFLNRIEEVLQQSFNNTIRTVLDKEIRVFKYYRDETNPDGRFVVPFGSKKKGVTYVQEADGVSLRSDNRSFYDVNSLYVDSDMQVALLTGDRPGPLPQNIEDYLNTYVQDDYKIRVRPILCNTALENIRNAEQVRSVTFALNLGRELNRMFNQVANAPENGVTHALRALTNSVRNELDNETFSLTVGMGKKRNTTMNIDVLVRILEEFNIEADCIREITVNYKDNTQEAVKPAKLKRGTIELYHNFSLRQNSISPEYLRMNAREAIDRWVRVWLGEQREYIRNMQCLGEDYEIRVGNVQDGMELMATAQ